MRRVTLHPGAREDVVTAADFYRRRAGEAVAQRFGVQLQRTLSVLQGTPDLGTPLSGGRRLMPLKVFPYAVVYVFDADVLIVLVVRHHRRSAGHGQGKGD